MFIKRLKKIFEMRYQIFEKNKPVDWSTAENLAFGTF